MMVEANRIPPIHQRRFEIGRREGALGGSNVDEMVDALGLPKFARLKMLNVSARNSSCFHSVIRNRRSREKSQSARPGARRIFLPALPKAQFPPVSTNGLEKAVREESPSDYGFEQEHEQDKE